MENRSMTTRIENGTEVTDTKYNGWANYETWNVALYINNDEPLYRRAQEYMRIMPRASYRGFIMWTGLQKQRTPDGVAWWGPLLNDAELDEMMAELVS